MNPTPSSPAPRRHVWRWVLLGAGICLAPFALLAMVAFSYVTLDRDARILRGHVMDATGSGWNTKVQVSVGRITLGAIGQGLRFVHHEDIADARLALRVVKHASVGVYERSSGKTGCSREQLFTATDQAMRQRGWTRMVGVADKNDTVLIYIPDDMKEDSPMDLCLAVVSGRELVVVSATVEPEALSALVAKHARGDLKGRMRLAKLRP